MKVYMLRNWFGHTVQSLKAPAAIPLPKEPIITAGFNIKDIDWGMLDSLSWTEKVAIWNYLIGIALSSFRLAPFAAFDFVQRQITYMSAESAAWTSIGWSAIAALYGAIAIIAMYFFPIQEIYQPIEIFPPRYLLRYKEQIWYAELQACGYDYKPYYCTCGSPGRVLMAEKRYFTTQFGPMDYWFTGYLWQRGTHEHFYYKTWYFGWAYVDFIGVCVKVSENLYKLKSGFVDPYVSELEVPYNRSMTEACKVWMETFP